MRKRTLLVPALLFIIAVFGCTRKASAQEESNESGASKTAKAEDSVDAYRLDVSFNELEDGKKLNTRHYSIDLTGGSNLAKRSGLDRAVGVRSVRRTTSEGTFPR